MSIILGIECSTIRASVALLQSGAIQERFVHDEAIKNSDVILPMAHALLAESGLSFQSLDAIAFGSGPGAFTGLRVACGVAQGLAFGLNLPVIPVSSLECLAEGLKPHRPIQEGTRVEALLDARMGEVYAAVLSSFNEDWVWTEAPRLLTPESLTDLSWTIDYRIGDAFLKMPQLSRDAWVSEAPQEPSAADLVKLAALRFNRGVGLLPPTDAELLYIRNKVALTSLERSQARG